MQLLISAVNVPACQPEVPDGGTLKASCGQPSCPHCLARNLVDSLVNAGVDIQGAVLQSEGPHGKVIDDLLAHTRQGGLPAPAPEPPPLVEQEPPAGADPSEPPAAA